MAIFIGNKELKDFYVGNTKVKEVYAGDKKVWPTEPTTILPIKGVAGRYWDESKEDSTAAGWFGDLEALQKLPEILGLGRYLVTDDRNMRKLDPKDSTKFLDGSPAALDGSMGQCMWCWNAHYFTTWQQGDLCFEAVSFHPIEGKNSIYVPSGGLSWMDAGVMDRTEEKLCSVISDDPRYRGGGGKEVDGTYPIADNAPQKTMLGMPATMLSSIDFGTNARKRGEGWEANWFVARAVVEYLTEIIMGTRNSQDDFNAELDTEGLRQGGFGMGATTMKDWGNYNGTNPIIPTSVGLEMGDSVGLVDFSATKADGTVAFQCKIPCFFGLVNAGFGNLYRFVRGLTSTITQNSTARNKEVFVAKSMYVDFNPENIGEGMLNVGVSPRSSGGFIKKKSYNGLCCMPTEIGGTYNTYYCDVLLGLNDAKEVFCVRASGGAVSNGLNAGVSATDTTLSASSNDSITTSPLCFFKEDPLLDRIYTEKLEWASQVLTGYGGQEVNGNWYYTYDQALVAAEEMGNGWRLPTKEEFDYFFKKEYPIRRIESNGVWVGKNWSLSQPTKILFLPNAGADLGIGDGIVGAEPVLLSSTRDNNQAHFLRVYGTTIEWSYAPAMFEVKMSILFVRDL